MAVFVERHGCWVVLTGSCPVTAMCGRVCGQGDGLSSKESRFTGLVALRTRLQASGLQPSDVLEDRICGEYAGLCPYTKPEL